MEFILTKELQQRIKKAFRKLCWKQSRGKPDERMSIDNAIRIQPDTSSGCNKHPPWP